MPLVNVLSLLSFLLVFVKGQRALWGPGVHLGPTQAGSEIIGMTVTLVPGSPPAKEVDFVAIWPGLWNPRAQQYDLVQSVIASHKRSYMEWFCNGKPGQWCARAYVLRSGHPVTTQKGHAIDAKDEIRIEYSRNVTGDGKWLQILTNLSKGTKLVEFTAGNRAATIFETGTEMQQQGKGTADDQLYTNLTLTLRTAEPNFGRTFTKSRNVQVGKLKTFDEGKTWTLDRILIPAMLPGSPPVPYAASKSLIGSNEL